MPKVISEPTTEIHVKVFTADLARLKLIFGDNIGVSEAIRTFTRAFLNQTEAKIRETIDAREGEVS